MNLLSKCNENEIKLIKKAGVELENKDYSKEELKEYEMQIVEFIMSHSLKSNEIYKLQSQYRNIFNIIDKNYK